MASGIQMEDIPTPDDVTDMITSLLFWDFTSWAQNGHAGGVVNEPNGLIPVRGPPSHCDHCWRPTPPLDIYVLILLELSPASLAKKEWTLQQLFSCLLQWGVCTEQKSGWLVRISHSVRKWHATEEDDYAHTVVVETLGSTHIILACEVGWQFEHVCA